MQKKMTKWEPARRMERRTNQGKRRNTWRGKRGRRIRKRKEKRGREKVALKVKAVFAVQAQPTTKLRRQSWTTETSADLGRIGVQKIEAALTRLKKAHWNPFAKDSKKLK
jgi:hypothetical protein